LGLILGFLVKNTEGVKILQTLTVKQIVKRFSVEKAEILRGYKIHKRLIIKPIVKRLGVKKE
jgi:hypothetical protein